MTDEIQGGFVGVPKLTPANAAEDARLAPVSPTGKAVLTLPPWLAIALSVLGVLVGTLVPSLLAAGVLLPAWVGPVAAAVTSILVALGIVGAGARTAPVK